MSLTTPHSCQIRYLLDVPPHMVSSAAPPLRLPRPLSLADLLSLTLSLAKYGVQDGTGKASLITSEVGCTYDTHSSC
jgi:hypothetical protein